MKKGSNERVENFQKVLAVNSRINSTLDINELLTIIMTTAAEVMRAETASLLLVEEPSGGLIFRVALGEKGSELTEKFRVKSGEGIAGSVAQSGQSIVVNDTKNDERFAARFDQSTGFVTKAILAVPMRAKGKIIGVLEALNPIAREGFSENDFELFEAFADQAAIAVENAKLHAEILKQEKVKHELKIAHEIQQNFLPDLRQQALEVDIAARNIPTRAVGGDFYDVVQLGSGRTGILVADVSGKGVPAALFMVNAISNYRTLASQYKDLSDLLRELNNKLVQNSTRGMFITLIYMIVDRQRNVLEYASCGHHPILRRLVSGDTEELESLEGVPLGLMADSEYPRKEISLLPGEALILYTDGITEARDKQGHEYSVSRLKECVRPAGENASAYEDRIYHDLKGFTEGADQHDDMTTLVVRME